MFDQLLEPTGLKYEELTSEERKTLNDWVEVLEETKVTVDKIKDHIKEMRDAVEEKLAVADLGKKEDIYLKARLRNYMLLEALLTNHEKAKKAIDSQLKGFLKK